MVAAVIHFARADIDMLELRLEEARVEALARGAVQLAIREMTMLRHVPAEQASNGETPDGEAAEEAGFSKVYFLGDDWQVSVDMRSAAGLVSLNEADREALQVLLSQLGAANEDVLRSFVDGVMTYSETFPGFRYVEELLAVEGSSRYVYDRIKEYVHPFRTGGFVLSEAPDAVAAIFERENDGPKTSQPLPEKGAAAPRGLVTFESIAEQQRNPNGASDRSIKVATVRVEGAGITDATQRLWVSPDAEDVVLRTEPARRIKTIEVFGER